MKRALPGKHGSVLRLGSVLFPALLTLAGAVALVVPGAGAALQLDRSRPLEIWRLLTSHVAHYSLEHWLLDTAALWVLWTACVRAGCRRGLAAVAVAALVIPLAVLGALPSLDHYRGLSGIDSALMGALVATGLRRGDTRTSLVSAGLFAAKLGYELFTARTFFVDSGAAGFVPVPLAHLLGALCGFLAARGPALGHRKYGNTVSHTKLPRIDSTVPHTPPSPAGQPQACCRAFGGERRRCVRHRTVDSWQLRVRHRIG